jgi:hypothetical protein
MFGAVTAVAEMLEDEFHERVLVNAYAAWGRSRGFKAHHDDHDVFILQLAGRKFWRIFGPSESRSIQNDAPPRGISWEGIIEEGDLLYIPRDWWHEVRPQGEASLHLTCGVQNRNGLDLLAWIQQELRSVEIYLSDLPRFLSHDEQLAHVAKLRDEFCRRFDDAVLSRFFEEHDAKAVPRPHLSLPWGVIPGELPEDDQIPIRFLLGRSTELNVSSDRQRCELVANGMRWQFSEASEPVLRALMEHRICSVSDICTTTSAGLDRHTVRSVISELLFQGLAAISSN